MFLIELTFFKEIISRVFGVHLGFYWIDKKFVIGPVQVDFFHRLGSGSMGSNPLKVLIIDKKM
jgi:hypothetical protein